MFLRIPVLNYRTGEPDGHELVNVDHMVRVSTGCKIAKSTIPATAITLNEVDGEGGNAVIWTSATLDEIAAKLGQVVEVYAMSDLRARESIAGRVPDQHPGGASSDDSEDMEDTQDPDSGPLDDDLEQV